MTTLLDPGRSVLVLVDHQARLMPAIHDAERVLDEAVFIASLAKVMGVPVLGTEQHPQALGANEPRVRALCEHTLSKVHFSATGDGLLQLMQRVAPAADQVVLAGCETHVCLMQTALGVLQAGRQVFVVPEACGSRRPADKALALARLNQAGVTLVNPEMLAFEWLRTCEHPRFREVLSMIKSRT
jgi:nicotinamidase-related amidase